MTLINKEKLFSLLQNDYFDNIDNNNPEGVYAAMHENVKWIHTQVWEHDGHDGSEVDVLTGQKSVIDFLKKRVPEMQIEGIEHKVDKVLTDGKSGSFLANVIGKDGTLKPFFGWVEIADEKIILYRVMPI